MSFLFMTISLPFQYFPGMPPMGGTHSTSFVSINYHYNRIFAHILPPPATRTRGVRCVSGTEGPEGVPTWHALLRKDPSDDRSTGPRRREDAARRTTSEGQARGVQRTTQGAQRPRERRATGETPRGAEAGLRRPRDLDGTRECQGRAPSRALARPSRVLLKAVARLHRKTGYRGIL
jgi:hypothetical protein